MSSNLKNPLAYHCPPKLLGAKNEMIDPKVALAGILESDRIWQLAVVETPDTSTLVLHYKGMVEHLYKVVLAKSPDGVSNGSTKLYQVFASLSSHLNGIGTEPTYKFSIWMVDHEGCIIEQHSVELKEVLQELFPEVETFKVLWKRSLEGSFLLNL